MDKISYLKNIKIIDLSYEDKEITLEMYNGGNTWYSIYGYIMDPENDMDKVLEELVKYFPRSIKEGNLEQVIRKSPINKINMKKLFHQSEDLRISLKQRKGNAKCRKCGGEAYKETKQTRSADEAATVYIECLEESCGYKQKL